MFVVLILFFHVSVDKKKLASLPPAELFSTFTTISEKGIFIKIYNDAILKYLP